MRQPAIIALASLDAQSATRRAIDILAGQDEGASPADLFAAILERKNGAQVLARLLAGKKLPADVAKVGIRTVRATGRDAPALIEALTKAGRLTAGLRVLSPEEMRKLVSDVLQTGDDHAVGIGHQNMSSGRTQPGGAQLIEFHLQAIVEIGPTAAGAVDALGQHIGAGFKLLEQLTDHLAAVVEHLHESADADGQQECDDERGNSAPQGWLSGQQTAIGRLGDRLSQSFN